VSKLVDGLRAKGLYNDHGLISGQKESFAVAHGRLTATYGWHLWSPTKQWPGHWTSHGKFSISAPGKSLRARDTVEALRIASKECGVTQWSPSPFSPRTAFVPTSVLHAHGIKPSRVYDLTQGNPQ
jgi:hypothetical protein